MQVKFKGKQKKTVFLVFPSLKDFGGFKDRPERCHDVRWYRENLRMRKSIQRWRIFGWFLAQKKKKTKTLKSDKVALIETNILNLMFLDIYIPYPLRIGYEQTHNKRQNTLKVASVLLFRHDVTFGFNSLFLSIFSESRYFQEVATFR